MSGPFTAEEKLLDEKDVLDMLKQGMSQNSIAIELGRSKQYISNVKNTLIHKGLITAEEIEEFKLLAIDNKILEILKPDISIKAICKKTHLDINVVKKSVQRLIATDRLPEGVIIIDGNENRSLKKMYKKELILQRLLQGNINTRQILAEFGIGETTLNRYVNELIAEGKITREMWENRNNETSEVDPEKEKQVLELLYSGKYNKFEIASIAGVYLKYVIWVSENLLDKSKIALQEKASIIDDQELQEQIIENLKKGFTYKYIAKILKITTDQLVATIKQLKNASRITSEEIRACRENRVEEDRNIILTYLKRGYSYPEIFDAMEWVFEKGYIDDQAKFLFSQGLITTKQYAKAKEDAPQGLKEIAAFVLEGLRQGKSYNEMINEDRSGYLSNARIKNAKHFLISSGQITEEEIEKYRQDRLNRGHNFIDAIVLKGLREGKTANEILEDSNSEMLTESKIIESRKRLIKSGKITAKEIENAKKENEKYLQKKLDKFVLKELKLGKTIAEIIDEYSEIVSERAVTDSKKRLIDLEQISLEEINQAKQQRIIEESKKRISKTGSASGFDKEVIAMLKKGFSIEELGKHFNLSLRRMYVYVGEIIPKYDITYADIKEFKIQAELEYNELKEKFKDTGSTKSQINFFELLRFYSEHGRLLSIEDMQLLEDSILLDKSLLSNRNLKFIIMQHIKRKDFLGAISFINQCLNTYSETQYTEPLEEFKSDIINKMKQNQIYDLLKKGVSTSQIAQELKMLEVDIIKIIREFNNNEGPRGRD